VDKTIQLQIKGVSPDFSSYQERVNTIHQQILDKSGKGGEYLGWVDYPEQLDEALLRRIETTANRLKQSCDIVVSIGIGGSYLGIIMGEQFVSDAFSVSNLRYAGHNISSDYTAALLNELEGKRFGLIVISKSGTTTEPAIAFRILLNKLKAQDPAYKSKVVAITDENKGALKSFADAEGFETYVIPDDVGGRYSVLTPVGLLPLAVRGVDIRAMLHGAKQARADQSIADLHDNAAYRYAVTRYDLYANHGKKIELLVAFEPSLTMFGEWWKQLFGESEGKDNKGLFPASVTYTTDLHSMGQYVQEGERHLLETVLFVDESRQEVVVPQIDSDLDQLGYLEGKSLQYINEQAMKGTMQAHLDGNVPQLLFTLIDRSAYTLGYVVFTMELACAMSGYLLDVNPFDQPGVEHYKRNMFALLGKPK
jgi:glucose-6-phosphate isomerase